ncbi:MAG: YgcG family protein [Steroidobacteraceae bacterium]
MRVARLGAGLVLLFGFALADAQVAVPPLTARVIDLTGTLSGGAVARIEAKLADLEARKGSQLAVLIVPTTQPEEIEQYGIRVAEAWKLGRKSVDDGAILLVAKDDRRVRIEVGQGLEGALPDAISNRIIAETITPHFKQADYDGGVEAGIDQMISVVNGEPLPQPDKKWERHGGLGNMLPLLLVVVFVVSGVLRAIFGRLFGSVATGGLTGGIVWLLSHVIPIGLGAGVVAFLFALLTGGSRPGWSTGRGWGGGMGGFGGGFGGGGFGGGGGGGFSGGGGGFSGGGASGSW